MNEEEFTKLTKLCRISCTDDEKEKFSSSISQILAYIELLGEVDTAGVKPCNTVLETMSNVLRDDIAKDYLARDLFLANSPAHVGGMVRVPPVIKQES